MCTGASTGRVTAWWLPVMMRGRAAEWRGTISMIISEVSKVSASMWSVAATYNMSAGLEIRLLIGAYKGHCEMSKPDDDSGALW